MSKYVSLLVGCGNRGQTHARAIAESNAFEFAAVCDHDSKQAKSVADEYDVPAVYEDHETALTDVDPDHVTTVTSPTVRTSLAADVLAWEPASYMFEKPVANTYREVHEIAELAEDAQTRVTVCHQKVYAEEIQTLKEWIDEATIGDIRHLVGSAKGGLTGQGTHFLHALNWLLGDSPERVRAFAEGGESLDPERNEAVAGHAEPRDTVLELTYPEDVRAFIHLGPDAPDVSAQAGTYWYEFTLNVSGTNGWGEFVLGDHVAAMTTDGERHVDVRGFEEDAYMTRALYDDLGKVLSGELDGHPADLDSAVTIHEIIEAAMRSALEGRAVAPGGQPPALGESTTVRLRRRLLGESQVAVSTLMYRDRPREAVLANLADLGVTEVDLWAFSEFATHIDPENESSEAVRADLDQYGLDAPVITFFDEEPVEETLAFASEIGAETAITFGRTPERPEHWNPDELERWLDCAAEHDMTIAFENHFDYMETIAETEAMLETLNHQAARVALAPPHLWHCAGERAPDALERLGDRVDVLYLWDTHPGVDGIGDDPWWHRADDQVPGGGGAVDFDRTLAAAVEHSPGAHWTLCYHGTADWSTERIDRSVARAMRTVESARPR